MLTMAKKEAIQELDYNYLDKIKDTKFTPVFIMGVQRSGTSILYKILSKTNTFNFVTSYDVIRNSELIYNHINNLEKKSKDELNDFLKTKSQTSRGIDNLAVTSDFPEEYGFVLAQKTDSSKITPKSYKIFENFCKKIQYISRNDKLLLLKNPFDFSNYIYIKSVFPKAKFIFIHRNPLNTLNSQLKALRTLTKNKSEYMALLSPDYNKLHDNKVLLQFYKFLYSSKTPFRINSAIKKLAESTNYYLENINRLKKEDYVITKYEDLCEKPSEEINKILAFLNLKQASNKDVGSQIKPRKTVFLKEITKNEKIIKQKMRPYFECCKYL